MTRLFCMKCDQEARETVEDPGTHARFVYGIVHLQSPGDTVAFGIDGRELGRAPHPQCVCDACSTPLLPGSPALAYSFWMGRHEEPPWEDGYLTAITDRVQKDY